MKRKPAILVLLATVLLVIGIGHFTHDFQPLGDAALSDPPRLLSGRSFREVVPDETLRIAEEPLLDYVARVNRLVHETTYNTHPRDFSLPIITRVLASVADPWIDFDWDQGLFGARFVGGYCHQRAIELANILRENGIDDAWAYGLNGHVVTRFSDEGGAVYLVDPDYGAGPFRYDADDAVVEAELMKSYGDALIPTDWSRNILAMVRDRQTNEFYYSQEHFDHLIARRDRLHRTAAFIAGSMVILGLGMLWLGLRGLTSGSRREGAFSHLFRKPLS